MTIPMSTVFPDIGQQMTWRLWWEHTAMLAEEAHGGCDYDLAEISREEAGQIAAERAALLACGRGPASLGRLCLSGVTRAVPHTGSWPAPAAAAVSDR